MAQKEEEKKKEPKPVRKTLIVRDDFIAETVVRDGWPFFAVFDRVSGLVEYVPDLMVDGRVHIPLYPGDQLMRFVSFPSAVEEYESDMNLLDDIRSFIHEWCDMEERYEKLAALYVMFTWAYDEFMEVPYLRILADLGSGKSRLGVQVMRRICYKGFATISASTLSPIFRTLDFLGGTFIIDEADLGDNSDKNSELVQLLNSGYIDELPIMRSELSAGGHVPKTYAVFGPKIIISRAHFKDAALESRCLHVRLTDTKREDIPYLLDKSINDKAASIRNQLLLWRFRGLGTRRNNIDQKFGTLDIPSRLKQLLLIMSGVVDDKGMRTILWDLAGTFRDEHLETRADTNEGEMAEAVLKRYMLYGKDELFVSCKDLAIDYNAEKPPNEQKNAKSVGWYLRERLALKTRKSNGLRGISLTKAILEPLARRYGLEDLLEKTDDKAPDFDVL